MHIIDTHCDALYQLQQAKRRHITLKYRDAKQLQTNVRKLKKGKVIVQFFAIFLDPTIPSDKMWEYAQEQITLFHTEVLEKNVEMKHITKWKQLHQLKQDEIGAVLTLEGAEPIGNDLEKLHTLYKQGVMAIGLTWNHANLCADGIGEPRGGGLTTFGKEVVALNNANQVLTDVSHLSVRGFWDVMEIADYPFVSHSNAKAICDHKRNLDDDQLKCLIQKQAPIHLVFYPDFVREKKKATIDHLLAHIDHISALGGMNQIGFGSDFDGIDRHVARLEHAGCYQNLVRELVKYYPDKNVRGFMHSNFLSYIRRTFKT